MHLPEKLRQQLKTPLGNLILEKNITKENLLKQIPKDSFVIAVGDATTERMLNFDLIPSLQIVDGLEKRSKRIPPNDSNISTNLSCNNPAGEITSDSIEIIKKAFQSKLPVRINVIGEEDLLVIPVCIYAPDNSIVLYGQPNEGIVLAQINTETRNKTTKILESMN